MNEGQFQSNVKLIKSSDKQIVTGVVFIPDVPDLQGDVISREDIEAAAHGYMINSRMSDLQHQIELGNDVVVPVESYIAPHDLVINGELIPSGSWVLTMKILDDGLWELVKNGELNGFSVTGSAFSDS